MLAGNLALYRALQEGLNNIVHHAAATEIWIRLHLTVQSAPNQGTSLLIRVPWSAARKVSETA